MTLVSAVHQRESAQERKQRGAFYTPAAVTRFLAHWAIRDSRMRVLEPSAGDGAFLVAAADRLASFGLHDEPDRLVGIELSAGEAAKCRALVPGATVLAESFFNIGRAEIGTFDSIVGNPPYIRYHGFAGEARQRALARADEQGVALSGLASSWAHFVVHACSFLPEDGGRLALVLPAELLRTDYAEPVRAFLLRRFKSVVVVTFDLALFGDAQVDAVLLLASDDGPAGLRIARLDSVESLQTFLTDQSTATASLGRWSTADSDPDHRVSAAYSDLVASDQFIRLSAFASVDIGIVTGANRFFVLPKEAVSTLDLPSDVLTPIVERPGRMTGLAARPTDIAHLLDLQKRPEAAADAAVARYLAAGVEAGVPKGYKCRARKLWYVVPHRLDPPQGFLPYMSSRAPRIIENSVGAHSTNLIHAVRWTGKPSARSLAISSLSAATALSAEMEGRAYGGGVLKLETREAERLLVPVLSAAQAQRLGRWANRVDGLLVAGRHAEASALVDGVLGVDHQLLDGLAQSLRARRTGLRSARN